MKILWVIAKNQKDEMGNLSKAFIIQTRRLEDVGADEEGVLRQPRVCNQAFGRRTQIINSSPQNCLITAHF